MNQRWELAGAVAAVVAAHALMWMHHAGVLDPRWIGSLQIALATVMLGTLGRRYIHRALGAARRRLVTVDSLVALSSGVTLLYSLVRWLADRTDPGLADATTTVVAFVHAGNLLKERAVESAAAALRGAAAGAPQKFQVTEGCPPDGDGRAYLSW